MLVVRERHADGLVLGALRQPVVLQRRRMAGGERHMLPLRVDERSHRDDDIATLTDAAPGTEEHA